MPVRTEDCRRAITSHFRQETLNLRAEINPGLLTAKKWKRVSKRGNPKKGFVRTFRNTDVLGVLVNVHSTENEITEIKLTADVLANNPTASNPNVNLKQRIQEIIRQTNHFYGSDLIFEFEFASLPRVRPYHSLPPSVQLEFEEEYYEDEEYLDFENREIMRITNDTIVIFCGGDWQIPGLWSATLREDGRLHYNHDVFWDTTYRDGLSSEEIALFAFDGNIPEDIYRKIG